MAEIYCAHLAPPTGEPGSDADCRDDEVALAWATITLGSDARAEVWQAARCLGRVSSFSVPLADAPKLAAVGG